MLLSSLYSLGLQDKPVLSGAANAISSFREVTIVPAAKRDKPTSYGGRNSLHASKVLFCAAETTTQKSTLRPSRRFIAVPDDSLKIN